MEFKNEGDLLKWLKKNQGSLVKNGHVTTSSGGKVKAGSGSYGLGEIKAQAEKLAAYLNDEINAYYTSYTPVEYKRTFEFLRSVRVGEASVTEDGTVSIEIYFDPELATHSSVFGDGNEDGYVPILLNEGWRWLGQKGWSGPYRFARYYPNNHGAKFVENAIERYIADTKPDPNIMEIFKKVIFHGVEDTFLSKKMN